MSNTAQRLNLYAMLHQDRLRSWVRHKLRGDAAAEDIAQETWLRAAPVLAGGTVANVEGYLYRVASNLIVDRVREERKRAEVILPDSGTIDVEASEPGAEAQLIERDRMAVLAAIIDDLPPRCREVFHLRKSEGLSARDIAERLGIGRNMVDKHLRHALLIIATRLGEVEA